MKGIINNGYIEVKKYPDPDNKDASVLDILGIYLMLNEANIASPEEDVWRIEIAERSKSICLCIHCNGSGAVACDFEIYTSCPMCKEGYDVSIDGTEVEFNLINNKGVIV